MKNKKKRLGVPGRQMALFVAGAVLASIPSMAQAQTSDGRLPNVAATLIPGDIPQDAAADPGTTQTSRPPQPGRLLGDTLSAPPLTTGEKLRFRLFSVWRPRTLAGLAVGAALSTGLDTPSEWGQGWSGYWRRYANGFGITVVNQTFEFGLDSALHEDPRYFPSEDHRFAPRIENVLKQIVICKKDNGDPSIAYSRIASAFATAQVANAWQPASTQGVGQGLERGLIILAAEGVINLAQEFVPITRPRTLRHKH